MPTITGFSHAALTITDLDRSLEWYQRVLGMTPVMSGDDEQHRFRLLAHPGSGTLVGLHEYADNSTGAFSERRTGLDHLAFAVPSRDELEAWVQAFDGFGDVSHEGITDAPYGSILVFRDPDGVQLEMAYLPQ